MTNIGSGEKRKQKTSIGVPELEGKKKYNAHEVDLAEKLGGRRQPQSGAMPGHKGDIKLDHFLLDSKQTAASSIIVNGADLTKITREAREDGRSPGLVLTIENVATITQKEWVLIPLEVFSQMLVEKQDERIE